ncbi:MAG TPA: HK97 family phage prohead protease [Candidatus Binatia bacterium]|nr:HK97 family phage prohead protease [Candidatus Binatia bacterium]
MIVEGYAALFGVEDQMHDIVRAGAFAASLKRRGETLPMLVEHERRLLAGHWNEVREDSRGLFLRGEIRDDQPGAVRAKRMIARGVDGLSIGFVPIVAHAHAKGRVLSEVELLEVSIVTHPMQPLARLTARALLDDVRPDAKPDATFAGRNMPRLTLARGFARAA